MPKKKDQGKVKKPSGTPKNILKQKKDLEIEKSRSEKYKTGYDEASDQGEDSLPSSRSESISKSKTKPFKAKEKLKPVTTASYAEDDTSEDETQTTVQAKSAGKSKEKAKVAKSKISKAVSTTEDETSDDSAQEKVKASSKQKGKTKAKPEKSKASKAAPVAEDDEEEDVVQDQAKSSSKQKESPKTKVEKGKASKAVPVAKDDEEEDGVQDQAKSSSKQKESPKTKVEKGKASKAAPVAKDDEEEDVVQEKVKSSSKPGKKVQEKEVEVSTVSAEDEDESTDVTQTTTKASEPVKASAKPGKKAQKTEVTESSTTITKVEKSEKDTQATVTSSSLRSTKTYATSIGTNPRTPGAQDAQWFMKLAKTGDFSKIQGAVFSIRVDRLASKDNEDFLETFLTRFSDLDNRGTIASNILDKIRIYEEGNPPLAMTPRLNALKANTLIMQAQNSLDKVLKNNMASTAITEAEKAVVAIESAYKICYTNSGAEFNGRGKLSLATETLDNIIKSISDPLEQFKLLELASKARKSNLPEDELCLIDLLIKLGEYSPKFTNLGLKAKVMNYNAEAYNILSKQEELTKEQAVKFIAVLSNLKAMAAEFLDVGKSNMLNTQMAYIKMHYLKEDIKGSEIGSGKGKDEGLSKLEGLLPILKIGITTDLALQVKTCIQTSVLDKIQEASAKGKWTDKGFGGDYGVGGYLAEPWLKKQMGSLFNTETHEIALTLAFEAINTGIMNAKEFNPLCAAVYCKKYPAIARKALIDHPECFGDGRMVKISLIDSDKHSVSLFGKEVQSNSDYNYYFEELAMPMITERIKGPILLPIENIVKTGAWSTAIESRLMGLLDDGFIKTTIGSNWSEIPDLFSIVRIVAFKKLTETIETTKTTNFSPVDCFIQAYPGLVKRISTDHDEMLNNEFIFKRFEEAQKQVGDKPSGSGSSTTSTTAASTTTTTTTTDSTTTAVEVAGDSPDFEEFT